MTWVIASFITAVLTLGIYCLVVLPRYGWRKVAAPSVLGLVYTAFLFCSLQALGHVIDIARQLFDLVPGLGDAGDRIFGTK